MDDSGNAIFRYFKKTSKSIDKIPAELHSLNGTISCDTIDITKGSSVKEDLATETTDKLLKRLTRFFIDNGTTCEILANSYQDIRRECFLYKKRRIKRKNYLRS